MRELHSEFSAEKAAKRPGNKERVAALEAILHLEDFTLRNIGDSEDEAPPKRASKRVRDSDDEVPAPAPKKMALPSKVIERVTKRVAAPVKAPLVDGLRTPMPSPPSSVTRTFARANTVFQTSFSGRKRTLGDTLRAMAALLDVSDDTELVIDIAFNTAKAL